MRRTLPLLAFGLVIGLGGCVADVPDLPAKYRNQAPVISGQADLSLTEGTEQRIELAVSDDRDALDDLAIEWSVTQTSGNAITLEPDGNAVTIAVPWQPTQTNATLTVKVTDSDGVSTQSELAMTIRKQTFLVAQAEKEQSGHGDLYRVAYPEATVTHLNDTLALQDDIDLPTLSPNGQTLAYVRLDEAGGDDQLILTPSTGDEAITVELPAENGTDIVRLAWNHSASQLAVVTRTDDTSPVTHLQLVDAEGTPTLITDGEGLEGADRFAFSADDQSLALVNGQGELVWYDIASQTGTSIYRAGETGFEAGVEFHWHPEDATLAYSAVRGADGSTSVYLATADTLETDPVALATGLHGQSVDVSQLDWSPRGTYLSFIADRVTDDQNELFVLETATALADPASVTPVRINGTLEPAGGDVDQYRWSPDESRLAYSADQLVDNTVELFSSTVSGSGNRQLTDFGDQSQRLFWDWASADALIAVVSAPNLDGAAKYRLSVYDITPDVDTDYRVLTQQLYNNVPSDGVDDIQMSPDGAWLTVQSKNVSTLKVQTYVLDLSGTELRQVSELEGDETHIRYVWSPNSDGILYLTLDSDGDGQRLVYQPLDTLPDRAVGSLLGDLAPGGHILGFQIAQ